VEMRAQLIVISEGYDGGFMKWLNQKPEKDTVRDRQKKGK